MRIGELSRRTGVSARLLRYYEEQGLLTAERDSNGYRRYCAQAPERVTRIRELLAAGLTTEVIRDLLPCVQGGPGLIGCSRSEGILQRQLDRLETEMEQIRRRRDALLKVREVSEARRRADQELARMALRAS
ncbi:MerR family transcriptional regulator [Streptomyces orinoci]|uniref:MerR family transcriptional regulator n=1 Tax=Streptomyces orinoci TaxID=67339 RepID=A0ABV3JU86_STRON|nr:MerR family transcriptional regulator [Streptomyces orinoci]